MNMQGVIELLPIDIRKLALITSMLAISLPFLINRIKANKAWNEIKSNAEPINQAKEGRYCTAAELAETRRLMVGNMIRSDDLRRQTLSMAAFYMVFFGVELLFSIRSNIIYGTAIDVDLAVVVFFGLVAAPMFHLSFSKVYSEITESLQVVKRDLGIHTKKRLVMDDIATVDADSLNKISNKIFG